jgi:hypothetical protein
MAAAFALSVAHSVYRIPIQVSDSLDAILVSRHADSSLTLLRDASTWSTTTLRPLRYLQARWLVALADSTGWSYHPVFRGGHAALAIALIALLTWIARPRRWIDVAALGVALTVMVGLHTFDAIMRESFPVNHYAEVAAATLFVLAIARRPPRVVFQIATLIFLVAGLLLVESAVLIGIVIVACAIVRMPGVRRWTAVAAVLVLAAFLAGRAALHITSPGIGSHSTGWGGRVLEGQELEARFGANPWPLYAYNLAGGTLSLLASEPRFGFYQLLGPRPNGELSPVVPINIASSLLTTLAIVVSGVAMWAARPSHSGGANASSATTNRSGSAVSNTATDTGELDLKVLVVGAVVILASAALCLNYIKDDIISTAGAIYAVMAFIAVRWWLTQLATPVRTSTSVVGACLIVSAPLWAFRTAGTHYELRHMAFVSQNDWAMKSARELAGGDSARIDDVEMTARIRRDELRRTLTSPRFLPDWADRYWVE